MDARTAREARPVIGCGTTKAAGKDGAIVQALLSGPLGAFYAVRGAGKPKLEVKVEKG